jgi:hypothetical protein
MNRRRFLTTSLSAAGAGALGAGVAARSSKPTPEYYELRQYHLRVTMRQRFSEHFRDEAVPAYNRAGISNVGVFTVGFGPDSPTFWVLLTHKTPQSVVELDAKLQADEKYRSSSFLKLPSTDAGYVRIDSQLMVAFDGIPVLEKPTGAASGPGRVFELRTYESHNKTAHRKKVEMFNQGEIDIFRRTGLTPVFFGSNIVGSRLPSLTYLLVFEDMAARERNWPQFVNHPDWKKLVATPGYSDNEIVTNIHSFILRPTPYSQI